MAAPAFQSAGTYAQTAGGNPATSISVPVPAGVAAGDVIEIHIFTDTTTVTITAPAGFTESPDSPATIVANQKASVYWKRASGADSGSYSVTFSGSSFAEAVAIRYSGCIASGTPYDVSTSTTDSASGTVTPAVSVTTNGADRLIVHKGTDWSGGVWTPGAGFTDRAQGGFGVLFVQTKTQAGAGSTGSVTATCTGSDKRTAWLAALLPVPPASSPVGPALVVGQAVNRSNTY